MAQSPSLTFVYDPFALQLLDTDNDGIFDVYDDDDDGDGMPDEWEIENGLDPVDDDADGDADGDGLNNLDEYQNALDPNNPDSDGDGWSDLHEIQAIPIRWMPTKFPQSPSSQSAAQDRRIEPGRSDLSAGHAACGRRAHQRPCRRDIRHDPCDRDYRVANGEANQPLAVEPDLSITGAGN